MKRIIIFTSNDEIFSFRIVEKIINYKKFKNFNFEIILTNPPLTRKIKLLLVVFFSGGIHDLLKIYNNRVKKKHLLKRNVQFVSSLKKKYNFGISINYLNKIKLKKYKIFNFHIGNLFNQRGSFVFFYKFLYNWNYVDLTCHLISSKFDSGYILKKKKIDVRKNFTPIKIINLYNLNITFIINCIKSIIKGNVKYKYQNKNKKLNYVPSYSKIFSNYRIY